MRLVTLIAVFAAAGLGGLMLAPVTSDAGARVKGQYATSESPYWMVGTLNPKLSLACRRGLFLQRKHLQLSIGYLGKKGKGITGVATKGYNLFDKLNLAEADKTYHFFHQGYSNCKVYVAKIPPKRNK